VLFRFTQKLCVYRHQDVDWPQRIMTCPMLINRIIWSDCIDNSLCVENLEGRLCAEDLENLRRWTISVFPNQAKSLTNQGYDDLKFMARRFKSQFPKLLNQPYSQHLYEVSCQLDSEIWMWSLPCGNILSQDWIKNFIF